MYSSAHLHVTCPRMARFSGSLPVGTALLGFSLGRKLHKLARCPGTLEHHSYFDSRTIHGYFWQVSLTMVKFVTVI
jgi:hypothetical protein